MYDEDISVINEWFENRDDRIYETYHHTKEDDGEDVYCIAESDMKDFTDMLANNMPDLIGFQCMVGNNGIWFSSEDLKKAEFY